MLYLVGGRWASPWLFESGWELEALAQSWHSSVERREGFFFWENLTENKN